MSTNTRQPLPSYKEVIRDDAAKWLTSIVTGHLIACLEDSLRCGD